MNTRSLAWIALVPSAALLAQPSAQVQSCATPHFASQVLQDFDPDILRRTQDLLRYDATSEENLRKVADEYQAKGQITPQERVREFELVVASPEFQAADSKKLNALNSYDARVQDVRRYESSGMPQQACVAAIEATTFLRIAHSASRVQYSMLRARMDALMRSKQTVP